MPSRCSVELPGAGLETRELQRRSVWTGIVPVPMYVEKPMALPRVGVETRERQRMSGRLVPIQVPMIVEVLSEGPSAADETRARPRMLERLVSLQVKWLSASGPCRRFSPLRLTCSVRQSCAQAFQFRGTSGSWWSCRESASRRARKVELLEGSPVPMVVMSWAEFRSPSTRRASSRTRSRSSWTFPVRWHREVVRGGSSRPASSSSCSPSAGVATSLVSHAAGVAIFQVSPSAGMGGTEEAPSGTRLSLRPGPGAREPNPGRGTFGFVHLLRRADMEIIHRPSRTAVTCTAGRFSTVGDASECGVAGLRHGRRAHWPYSPRAASTPAATRAADARLAAGVAAATCASPSDPSAYARSRSPRSVSIRTAPRATAARRAAGGCRRRLRNVPRLLLVLDSHLLR